ncbi:MAG: bifunctional molybdenum cofactor biosynthesis protein MoaC/MoaB [Leptospirales bacterium]
MINISAKFRTLRTATAKATLHLSPNTIVLIRSGKIPKGNPLEVAKVAAVMAAKNTPQIIPYCHPLSVEGVDLSFEFDSSRIDLFVTVTAIDKTGVEVEAMTSAAICALTLYDMLKMVDDSLSIGSISLVEKKGGKSDFREELATTLSAAVVVCSDSVHAGKKADKTGPLIRERLLSLGFPSPSYTVIPDDRDLIESVLLDLCDTQKIRLILTTGGTGFSPRDTTPEATSNILEREAPGISEMLRAYGQERTPYSMLSRGIAGIRGGTIIVNLPGSMGGVEDALTSLFPAILHAFGILESRPHDTPGEHK